MPASFSITITLQGAQQAVQRMRDFNRSISNGASAVQQWAGAASAFLGLRALAGFVEQAVQAEQAVRSRQKR